MDTPWCVKVTCLPQRITREELAKMFHIECDSIAIPHGQSNNYYAWVNGFQNERTAEDFVKKWNRTKIRSSTIICKTAPTKSNVLQRWPSVQRPNATRNIWSGSQEHAHSKRGVSLDYERVLTTTASNIVDHSHDDEDVNTDALATTARGRIASFKSHISDSSDSSKRGKCRKGRDCFNPLCEFDHPREWRACEDGTDCDNFDCPANHPLDRKEPCVNGADCKNIACQLLHPKTRISECNDGEECLNWDCRALHPENRRKPCFFGKQCRNITCQRLHPPDRRLCANGDECTEFDCELDHSPGRMMRCNQGDDCTNFFCNFLHPNTWDPCEDGSKCQNLQCPHAIHPSNRTLYSQKRATNRRGQQQLDPLLKSAEQRKVERERNQLPILASQDIFCQRLATERILVVTAETGSGKSTQLPQYAAECFGGLVVCTQPRVVAAVSLARRVADEYDGISVGRSVGYRVGNSSGIGKGRNKAPGTDIVFMTDSMLIQESQEDKLLRKIKVLIIDEAHERSLNTDIVIGLAKLLLKERPLDFYVVIASATIDSVKFLKYFGRENVQALNVPGRVFDISIEYQPKPEDSTDEAHAVSVLSQLYEKHQGHTLVFLPGQKEIERAIESFSGNIPDNCVALPLYGSLSPEEQDKVLQFDEGPTGERRMVVFCTNIAETSLTIKNTRLVIDSGLAKEARFDIDRRLTVIETVRIARSSADQRKGRAGRTASGHCVRLYKVEDLTRLDIQPEILRSSLDLVVLQLLRLKLKPETFPFMDLPSPGEAILRRSLQLLKDLSCSDINDAITLRGELFSELNFDPRLSSFMVDAYIEHSPILEVVAAIVAILTAPGSIFFMGAPTKEAKQETRGRIAARAQEYESDLLYLVSVYDEWKKVGMLDPITQICNTCKKTVKRNSSCRSCRATYSVSTKLNNKVLNTIESSCDASIRTITNPRWHLSTVDLLNGNNSNIISTHLLKKFPEHLGYVLVPHLPNEGICMVANDLRARITATSVFVQRHLNTSHFIAMAIAKLPTGDYVIERLHPISSSKTTNVRTIKNIHTFNNVGWEWNSEIRKEVSNLKTESWNKWLVCEYDRRQCCLRVWGDENMRDSILQFLKPIVEKTHDSLLRKNISFPCGHIQAIFKSGLCCTSIENKHEIDRNKNRLDLCRVPCKTMEELFKWIQETLGLHRQDIRENTFQSCKDAVANDDTYESPPFFVVFRSDEAFKKAVSKLPLFYMCLGQADAFDTVYMSEKETWGRQLLLKRKENEFLTVEDVKTEFPKYFVNCKQLGKNLLPGLLISNMPTSINRERVKQVLGNSLVPARIDIFFSDPDDSSMGSATVRIYFTDKKQYNQAITCLRSSKLLKSHLITIFSKKSNRQKDILVTPSIEEVRMEPQTFLVTTVSRQRALKMYSQPPLKWTVNSSACTTVTHLDHYQNFDDLVGQICSRFGVKLDRHPLLANNNKSNAVRCIFTDATPPKTALAASALSQATSPIIIKLTDERQKCLFNELFNDSIIQAWADELKLSCEKKGKYGTVIEIHGPQVQKGQLMRRIADYADRFDSRYRVLDLNASLIGFFGRQKAAEVKLREIDAMWEPKGCSVTLERKTSSIRVYAQPTMSMDMMQDCEKEVKELLDKLVIANDIEDEQIDFSRQCAFCQRTMIATRIFHICGHAYCRCALNMLNALPLQCPTCKTRIHIQDIKEILANNQAHLKQLCKSSIQAYLSTSTNMRDQDQLFCPNDECDGLIRRSQGYQTCLTCGKNVCGLCRLIDDQLHEDRTCEERTKAQRDMGEFIPQLFKAAEIFTRDSWPVDLPPIIHFDKNACLEETSSETLNRFYKGVEFIRGTLPPDLARGVFAFHGTSANSIQSICESGFDPTRRRGQVHGPGEYFGITASISHGYGKDYETSAADRMMIVAFILQCDRVKKVAGFCYVVNNLIDRTAAFNLPVAVVTYGKNSSKIQRTSFLFTDVLSKIDTWKAPFRWYWQQDNKTFEPYNDKINDILEQFYEKWQLGQGPSKVITPPLVRYVDDIPQSYEIDFTINKQRNTRTNFPRSIERRSLPESTKIVKRNWFFFNENQTWAPYESLIQQTIDNAYEAYSFGRGQRKVVIRFPGRPEDYELNFVDGTQMNKTTREIRRIKRQ